MWQLGDIETASVPEQRVIVILNNLSSTSYFLSLISPHFTIQPLWEKPQYFLMMILILDFKDFVIFQCMVFTFYVWVCPFLPVSISFWLVDGLRCCPYHCVVSCLHSVCVHNLQSIHLNCIKTGIEHKLFYKNYRGKKAAVSSHDWGHSDILDTQHTLFCN